MIFDGFIFFNELDMLELRLETMWENVDKFILVESKKTFTNVDKPLYYEENKQRFNKYNSKIVHIVIDEFPQDCKDAWDREQFQRNAIWRGVVKAKDDDVLIVSDLDEIISPYGIRRAKKLLEHNSGLLINFELLNFWYYLNYVDQKVFFWSAPKAYTIKTGNKITPQEARSSKDVFTVQCAGWHFSYIGGIDKIKDKVRAFSHQEYNSDEWLNDERIEQMMKDGKDLFGRGISDFVSLPICNLLPKPIIENIDKYKSFLCEYRPISKRKMMKLRIKYLMETTCLRNVYHLFRR